MDTKIFDKVQEPNKTQKDNSGESSATDYSALRVDDSAEYEPSEDKDVKQKKKNKKKNSPSAFINDLYDWVSAGLFALVVVVLLMTFCFRLVNVDGSSMLQTLQDGNKVIVMGLDYKPSVGDIIVISHGAELDKALVKRIIAVEGQTVDINSETGEVIVDNVVIDEPYINGKTVAEGDMEFPLKVEEGTVFVLGDNRPISKDSRYKEVGLIDVESIIGKVQLRIYPFNEFGKVK